MKELTLEATLEHIATVTDFVNEVLETMDCPMKAQIQIDVAVDEIFSNIARYAYTDGPGMATVRVELEQNSNAAMITFLDQGQPYNPLESVDPDITLSAEQRSVGGLGIFLVKKTMDGLGYEYKDGQNVFWIKKNL